jgi:hypothetical protein
MAVMIECLPMMAVALMGIVGIAYLIGRGADGGMTPKALWTVSVVALLIETLHALLT